MASLALDPAYRRVSVEEFLRMDFGDAKAELVEGVIFMMAGAASLHNLIAGNVFTSLRVKLRGSGCLPYNSDQAVKTMSDTLRYPDISVFCGDEALPVDAKQTLLGTPTVIFEILSPSTDTNDQREKLREYQAMPGVKCIVFVAPETERIRKVERTGDDGWNDRWLRDDQEVEIACLSIALNRAEVFARD